MANLKFSPDSITDLKEIEFYITEELLNESSAKETVIKILENIKILTLFPLSGSPLSSIINIHAPYRFLVCGNYTAFYKVEKNDVYIIRILYNKRNYMDILFGEWSKE